MADFLPAHGQKFLLSDPTYILYPGMRTGVTYPRLGAL